jgi:hypothetical protein
MIDSSPIIIFGAPRSGTTYLNKLLNQHPEVFISHEARLFAWLHESLKVLPRQDRLLVTYRDQFTNYLGDSLPELVRNFYATRWPHARYWGDKNPHYADPANKGCLNTIIEVFPAARFLHIIRDGRDVVSSLVRKFDDNGRPWTDLTSAPKVWTSHITIGCDFGATVPARQYLEVRYEKLVKDDIATARQVFDFLDIPFHQRVEDFCKTQRVTRTPFSGPTRELSDDATVSDWARLFTSRQRLDVLNVLGPNLVKLGYETELSFGEAVNDLRRELGLSTVVAERDG